MNEYYYEIEISSSNGLEFFETFILDYLNEAIELRDNRLILYTEHDPLTLKSALQDYALKLKTIMNQEIELQFLHTKKKNSDWVKAYQKSIKPIKIEDIYIHASWHSPLKNMFNIIIDPSLAFGTGHHVTTRLALKMTLSHLKQDMKVLDLGCGSGILGIVCAKKGNIVDFCDIDCEAIKNAKQNLEINNIKNSHIWCGSLEKKDKKYDLIIANIVTDTLVELKKDILKALNSNGMVVLSGILEKYENKIKKEYSNLSLIDKKQDGEWLSLIYKKDEEK